MTNGPDSTNIALDFFAWWTAQKYQTFCETLGIEPEPDFADRVGKLLIGKNKPLAVVQMRNMRLQAPRSAEVLLAAVEGPVRPRKNAALEGRKTTAAGKRIGRPPIAKPKVHLKRGSEEGKTHASESQKNYWANLTPRQRAMEAKRRQEVRMGLREPKGKKKGKYAKQGGIHGDSSATIASSEHQPGDTRPGVGIRVA